MNADGRTVAFADGRTLEVRNVVWATGFRYDFSFVDVPVFDARGLPIQQRGVSPSPGLYFVGLEWQHTRGSGLIGWVKDDAAFITEAILAEAIRI